VKFEGRIRPKDQEGRGNQDISEKVTSFSVQQPSSSMIPFRIEKTR
jgi:hypothetical protein